MKFDAKMEAIITRVSAWPVLSNTLAGTYIFVRKDTREVLYIGENRNIKKRLSQYDFLGYANYLDFQGVEVVIPLRSLTPEKAEFLN